MWPFSKFKEMDDRIATLAGQVGRQEKAIEALKKETEVYQDPSQFFFFYGSPKDGYSKKHLGGRPKVGEAVRALIEHLGLEFKTEQKSEIPARFEKAKKKK